MLNLLHSNIVEYILNPYLNYSNDISKLKRLFDHKFNIKPHLSYNIYNYKRSTYVDEIKIKMEERYSHKQLKLKYNYKNGNLDGIQEEWYENGQPRCKLNYKDGKLNGTQIKYNENGQIKHKNDFFENRLTRLCDYEN